jgi:hypothetical protein
MPDNKNPTDLHSVYEKIHEERRRRVEEHKRSVVLKRAEAGRQLNILADGDSWFSYPLSLDVIDYVRQDGNPTPIVLDLAVAGDPTTATLGVEKREQIIKTLSDSEHGEFDAMLFSGGGDDVAGDQFNRERHGYQSASLFGHPGSGRDGLQRPLCNLWGHSAQLQNFYSFV